MAILSKLPLSHLHQVQNIVDEEIKNFGTGWLYSAALIVFPDDMVKLISDLLILLSLQVNFDDFFQL